MSIYGNPVMMGGSGGSNIQPLSVTQNGTYTASGGVDGYSPVDVQVSGGDDPFALTKYIQSSGTQYIDTGYYPNNNTDVEIVASVSRGSNNYPTIFGMRPQSYSASGSHDLLIHFYSVNESNTLFQRNTAVAIGQYQKYTDVKAQYSIGKSGYGVETKKYANVNKTVDLTGDVYSTYTLYLFNFNNMGASFGSEGACIMKLYRMRIFENGTLVHEFLPWEDNGVACLKDTVSGTLKYNAGTGSFVYGEDT